MSDKNHEQSSVYGVAIKVENLNLCRTFYRDILNLGPPVMDSNFWVEFKIGANASLLLEEIEQGTKLPPGRGRVAWICEVKDFDACVALLKEKGHEPLGNPEERCGRQAVPFADPEGNPFYLLSNG